MTSAKPMRLRNGRSRGSAPTVLTTYWTRSGRRGSIRFLCCSKMQLQGEREGSGHFTEKEEHPRLSGSSYENCVRLNYSMVLSAILQ